MIDSDIKFPTHTEIKAIEEQAHVLRALAMRAWAVSFSDHVKALFHRPRHVEHIL